MVTILSTTFSVPSSGPRCRKCHSESKLLVTRSGNRNGNAGRPYYRCSKCPEFLCFADERGIDQGNPICLCGVPSRRQISGSLKRVPRGLHYVCSRGECFFYLPLYGSHGEQVGLAEELTDIFIQLRII
ncbi:hypothetical protein IQ06DRAFT_363756 [Phaeosphaeriaceae sp. SRC1lsM3a]|nr:hypothetical protein IQ06DRAFT_363756 [Stagonospora sp. SRC1lsM3a]